MEFVQGFEAAYDEHVWDVYGFFGYRVRKREEAEDLTQVTFERALKAWSRFDPERASVKTWLLFIAHNVLVDHYRRSSVRPEDLLPVEDVESVSGLREPQTDIDERGLGPSPELEDALAQLTDREREVIALRFGGDLKGAEIAEITGLTLANVQQLLSRSLRGMRKRIEESEAPSGAEGTDAGQAGRSEGEQR